MGHSKKKNKPKTGGSQIWLTGGSRPSCPDGKGEREASLYNARRHGRRDSKETLWKPLHGVSDSAWEDLGGFGEVMQELRFEAMWRRQGRDSREGTDCAQAGH